MLTDKDKHSLTAGFRWHRRGLAVGWLATSGLLLTALLDLNYAARLGELEDLDLATLFSRWAAGYETNQLYSGIYAMAISRIERAFYEFGFVIITLIGVVFATIDHRRDIRIASALRDAGQLPADKNHAA